MNELHLQFLSVGECIIAIEWEISKFTLLLYDNNFKDMFSFLLHYIDMAATVTSYFVQ